MPCNMGLRLLVGCQDRVGGWGTDQGCSMIWGMLKRLEVSATRIRFIKSLQSLDTLM